MKPALLAASLATCAVASAAELKDPAAVALEWQNLVAQAPAIRAPQTGLRHQVQPPPIFPERAFQETPLWEPKAKKPEANPFGDGPLRPPDDKNGHPRGAKPYKFKDDTYWLIPLTS